MRTLILTVIMILILSIPVMAEEPGIHGSLFFDYELGLNFPGQLWGSDLHYNINDDISIGFLYTMYTESFRDYFSFTPSAYYPTCDAYEFYAKFEIVDNLSIKLSNWHKRSYFHDAYSGEPFTTYGYYIRGEFKF